MQVDIRPDRIVLMKILHVFDHSLPLHSGYTFRSRSILLEQRRRGWHTAHLTGLRQVGEYQGDLEVADGLSFYRTPRPGLMPALPGVREWLEMQSVTRRLFEVAEIEQPDILHAHSPLLNARPALAVGRKLGIPVVYEIRAFWEDAAVDHGSRREGSLGYRITRSLETRAAQQADHVFTICAGLRNELISRGLPATRVSLIPNAVDVDGFDFDPPPDQALKQSLGLEGRTIIGFAGSFYAYEGLDLLIEALPDISRRMPQVHVVLVGGGPMLESLKAQAAGLGITDRVTFVGRVPHADIDRYYSIFDVLAFPRHPMRLTNLVTPLKPLEAMAMGRLLVASDVGGHRELIDDGRTGVLFNAGDPAHFVERLEWLMERQDLWQIMRMQGRHYVESERNWARSISNYVPIYERLARRR